MTIRHFVQAAALGGLLCASPLPAQVLCPDGTYVPGDPDTGTCRLAPDGTYVAGSERLPGSSAETEPPRPTEGGGFASGFREGIERSRARRAAEEENRRARERHGLEMEILRQRPAEERNAAQDATSRELRDLPALEEGAQGRLRLSQEELAPDGTVGFLKSMYAVGEQQFVATYMSGLRDGYKIGLIRAGVQSAASEEGWKELSECIGQHSGDELAERFVTLDSEWDSFYADDMFIGFMEGLCPFEL